MSEAVGHNKERAERLLEQYQALQRSRSDLLKKVTESRQTVADLTNMRSDHALRHAEVIKRVWADVGKGNAYDQPLVKEAREEYHLQDNMLALQIDSGKESSEAALAMAQVMSEEMSAILQQLVQLSSERTALAAVEATKASAEATRVTARATVALALLTALLVVATAVSTLVNIDGDPPLQPPTIEQTADE